MGPKPIYEPNPGQDLSNDTFGNIVGGLVVECIEDKHPNTQTDLLNYRYRFNYRGDFLKLFNLEVNV